MSSNPMSHEPPCCGVSTNIEDYFLTRRKFLNRVGMGLGALGLAAMLDPADLWAAPEGTGGATAGNPLAPRPPPLPGKGASRRRKRGSRSRSTISARCSAVTWRS